SVYGTHRDAVHRHLPSFPTRRSSDLEIMPQPPEKENKLLTWPDWPLKLRISSSHEEGVERDFAVGTVSFSGEHGSVKTLHCARVDRKSTRLNSSHVSISYAVFCLKKK